MHLIVLKKLCATDQEIIDFGSLPRYAAIRWLKHRSVRPIFVSELPETSEYDELQTCVSF